MFFFLSPVPALHSRMRARQYTYFCTPSTTLQLQLRAIRYTGMLITYRNYFSFFLSFYFVYLFTFFNFLCLISPPAPSRHRRRAIAATIIPPVFFLYTAANYYYYYYYGSLTRCVCAIIKINNIKVRNPEIKKIYITFA